MTVADAHNQSADERRLGGYTPRVAALSELAIIKDEHNSRFGVVKEQLRLKSIQLAAAQSGADGWESAEDVRLHCRRLEVQIDRLKAEFVVVEGELGGLRRLSDKLENGEVDEVVAYFEGLADVEGRHTISDDELWQVQDAVTRGYRVLARNLTAGQSVVSL